MSRGYQGEDDFVICCRSGSRTNTDKNYDLLFDIGIVTIITIGILSTVRILGWMHET